MSRSSTQDTDGITWQTAAIQLGTVGLDLRTLVDASTLAELLNARFQDERTVIQRDGHHAVDVHDGSDIALAGAGLTVASGWVFGHGQIVSG